MKKPTENDRIRKIKPDRSTAETFITGFSNDEWETLIKRIFGKAANTVIDQEHSSFHKNDPAGHAFRLGRLLSRWNEILAIIDEELPPGESVEKLMKNLGMPIKPENIGISRKETEDAFLGSREIRSRYMTSSMLWDLGLLYEIELLPEQV